MQRRRIQAFIGSLVMILLSVNGCLDITVSTKVNTDGSLERTMIITGDSTSLYSGDFTFPIDDSWEKSYRKIDNRKFELTATRSFADVKELNSYLQEGGTRTLDVDVSFEEEFEWFFSTFRYRERFLRYNRLPSVPITDYVSQQELDLFIMHEVENKPFASKGDSLAMDDASDRFEAWDRRSKFEAFYQLLLTGTRKLNDPSFSPERLDEQKEDIFEACGKRFDDSDFYRGKKLDTLILDFQKFLGRRWVSSALLSATLDFEKYVNELKFQENVSENTYHVSATMPGIITNTNAGSIEGNTVTWSDFMILAYIGDYNLTVESRAVNWWAIILTAVVVVGGGILLIVSALRKKKE